MITESFDAHSEPIVKLETFYGPKKCLVEKCLVTFSHVIYEALLQSYECKQIAEIRYCNGAIPIKAFEINGEEVAFYLSPIGSALAGAALIEVNHLTGANQFVAFGSCGSLDNNKTKGAFIIATEAYRGEGLSYYFAEAQDYIDVKNAGRLEELFLELEIPYVTGRVWTTDSMLRETVHLVNRRKQEGCIAVEMELAGVQAVCDFYGFELYHFLAAGDVLAEDQYEATELADANHNLDKLKIALKIVERI